MEFCFLGGEHKFWLAATNAAAAAMNDAGTAAATNTAATHTAAGTAAATHAGLLL